MNKDMTSDLLNKFAWLAAKHKEDFTLMHYSDNGQYLFKALIGSAYFSMLSVSPDNLLDAYISISVQLSLGRADRNEND